MGLEDQLQSFMERANKLVPNTETKSKITKAGAEAYKNRLRAQTKAKHYSSHKDEKYGHMADNIDYVNSNIDGVNDGTSVVGWNNRYHAMNARFLNDGTRKIQPDHFVDVARRNSREAILQAEKDEYEKQVGGK
ncbi:HK97-gp10 family putative phage morphogenesis protein [Furfurilactobacillus siliginis]|uniref:Phage head-tail adapter protein n=1 Tax=Furfurilactobacillus siliginis TaxID=348151 RepID=A0A0R2L5K2_9LACO|nr:HK97-gp10 family putative phage morphogenesis protein [Furfurilactobacillus siliginis]KRN96850.1 hypothetical protein IV55_GL000718 [Furfurilactobacillus siliginis]GEK28518.1 phage head-tail adapter protein [Furfurilactobacillus siliginis]